GTWNNPYPATARGQNILYSSFEERPKHLDPARSYSSAEYAFIGQIYTPLLQYHYLQRPYALEPLGAANMPLARFFDIRGRELGADAPAARIATSVYDIKIRPGMRYQPHPALARDAVGNYLYHHLDAGQIAAVQTLNDFAQTGTREVHAQDYAYEIKRLAHPAIQSPVLSVMADNIVGMKEFAAALQAVAEAQRKRGEKVKIDLRAHTLQGVETPDDYTLRITLKGKYPQLLYWLAMPFFSPIPWEADTFYAQPGLNEKNINFDWWPLGSGAYMLSENNPNRQMILSRNPNYFGATYPSVGAPGDAEAGLLADAGKPLPFIDQAIYSLEKESIPYWNKFLQGYYDTSGISSESFDQAVRMGGQGELGLTEEMQRQGIRLVTAIASSTSYMGFNMRDPVVGGDGERARKLRRAIAIAVDYEEFIAIFRNGRGIAAHGAVPPGIFGYREGRDGMNPYVYDWVGGKAKRKPIEDARRLLAEAGYANGIDQATNQPLTLYFDVTGEGPDDLARFAWFRKQFEKLAVQLVFRNTSYNRFQEKMRKGNAQIFMWGWNADYPDPENFFFLLYGPNGKVEHDGENAANYHNAQFDALFDQMKNMDNGPARQALIDRMNDVLRADGPWLWGFHPKEFALSHQWYYNVKPNLMAHNTLQYKRIDAAARDRARAAWNPPIVWPLGMVAVLLVLVIIPAVFVYQRRQRQAPRSVGDPHG
ncbi:MAG: ABC transporter substrate-binding protein, partial [Gammaproteobacteria bacterium]|nr:ABC transporter substrate-binding protein [Gammaproteobacteria bacterium]